MGELLLEGLHLLAVLGLGDVQLALQLHYAGQVSRRGFIRLAGSSVRIWCFITGLGELVTYMNW
jgi:hypothetical protein